VHGAHASLARGDKLATSTLGKRFGADAAEHRERASELLASIHAAVLTTQPFAVHEACAREMDGDTTALESLDRFAVLGLCSLVVAQQRA
jgi:hypothetical protein